MVTISRTRTKHSPFSSIRWKILLAFLLIVGVSFAVMASSLTNLVSNYLYEQRIRQDSLSVEKLASTAAPLLASARTSALHETIVTASGDMGGRVLLVDADGKVQADSYALLSGTRLQLPEVLAILNGGESSAWGIHTMQESTLESDPSSYVAVVSAAMELNGRTGALVLVSPVQEMMESLARVQERLITVFLAVAGVALTVALVFSQIITRPISSLTSSIRKMTKGDLSVRTRVRGSGELRELAESYNAMAAQLESIDHSRNQFVSNASHELKTPMATMKILLESMMYQPDMPKELQQEFMQDMNHEIDRLTSIITDLLTLTQNDDHSLSLKLEPVDVSALTEETLRLLQPSAEQRALTLEGSIQPDITMQADSSKLGQVIYNLTENALKYTPDGGHVSVMLYTEDSTLILMVADDGVGIPQADLSHIFDRFYRVDKARSRETGGTGLGLSIVRQMVTLHGGTVSVNSKPGEGSLFTVRLPMNKKEGTA
ncbi:MAG: HAMP domain-containing protein [Clostridia bacterium]|nr:HAMP domain-containing protein [Clostridia bacterium]